MSIEGIDPIAEYKPAGPEQAREIAATLVRNNLLSIADANRHLAAHNASPLADGSLEMARQERSRLMGNPEFAQKFLAGDPEAMARLNGLDAKIARGGPEKLTDGASPASEYHFETAQRSPGLNENQIMEVNQDLTAWAQELGMTPSFARTLTSLAYDTDSAREKNPEQFASEQEQLFRRVLGPNADARLAEAQKTLNGMTQRKIDLGQLLKTGGCEVVVNLMNHLATRKK